MTTFEKIKNGIPNTINIPHELKDLCDWLDQNDYPISGEFELVEGGEETVKLWFGFDDVSDRFGVFGGGPDGSSYAFWIDDEGNQKIVHLGSEGEENHILSNNFIDWILDKPL